MKSLVMSQISQIWLPIVALSIFLAVFFVMLIYVFRKSTSERYTEIELLPFDEGEKV